MVGDPSYWKVMNAMVLYFDEKSFSKVMLAESEKVLQKRRSSKASKVVKASDYQSEASE